MAQRTESCEIPRPTSLHQTAAVPTVVLLLGWGTVTPQLQGSSVSLGGSWMGGRWGGAWDGRAGVTNGAVIHGR